MKTTTRLKLGHNSPYELYLIGSLNNEGFTPLKLPLVTNKDLDVLINDECSELILDRLTEILSRRVK